MADRAALRHDPAGWLHKALTASPDTAAMQIGSGGSPLSLAVLKTLGSQATAGGSSLPASPLSAATGSAPARNEPAGPPDPGSTIPRGSFVDLKV